MKKTVILSAMALVFSVASSEASATHESQANYELSVMESTNPFHMSIVKGDLETVQKLIDLGADVNERWNGMTPAMYAARYNRAEILKVLIAHDANLKLKCPKGFTAKKHAEASSATEAKQVIEKALSKKKK